MCRKITNTKIDQVRNSILFVAVSLHLVSSPKSIRWCAFSKMQAMLFCNSLRLSNWQIVESWTNKFRTSENQTALEQVKVCAEIGIKCMNYDPRNRPATWFIIRGMLGEVEISNWSITSDVATSTEGQVQLLNSKCI